jgi:hypothetical protein
MFTKDILLGMNILTLAGFVVMRLSLTLQGGEPPAFAICSGIGDQCSGDVVAIASALLDGCDGVSRSPRASTSSPAGKLGSAESERSRSSTSPETRRCQPRWSGLHRQFLQRWLKDIRRPSLGLLVPYERTLDSW